MPQTLTPEIDQLRAAVSGRVLLPDDADYDQARLVWNASVDRSPAVIVQCHTADDVSQAVGYAVRHGLEIAVRGGAHSMSGASVVDDGLMVDLSRMNRVAVDPEARLVRVGGGALLADVDAATQEHGLAVPAGLVSHTGVGGLTLGGGMGWLTRRAGLTIDNLVSAQVVTADGRILRASQDENLELFWALRGGGGNFGVVTEFEYRLHPAGPLVQLALTFWGLDRGAEVFRLARELSGGLPRDLNILVAALNAPPAPFVPEHLQLQPGYAILLVGFGEQETHDAVLARIREADPLFEFVTPMPYVALQQMFDEANAWGLHCYDKSCYLDGFTEPVIRTLTEVMPEKLSPMSIVMFYLLDEAYCEPAEDATAFGGGRSPRIAAFIIGVAPAAEALEPERAWVRTLWERLLPHAMGEGAYINGMTEIEEHRLRATYGAEKYARLQQAKATYDPDNVFRRNANILPAATV